MARLLGEAGCYRILFFDISDPQRCVNLMTSSIAPTQRKMLIEWANSSQSLLSGAQPQLSKRILRQEFEKLKPKIQLKLEATHTDDPTDISG
jgi:serine/threonine-protein kinase